jgi:NADPH:quinone reductase
VGRALFSVALIEKATVKAVVIHAPGAPEQLVMADVPEPDPGHGQVLVDVAFAGCNWADTQIRTGIYPHARTYPLVLGLEVAGTVAKLGPDVKGIAIGERVAAFLEQGGAYAQKAVVAANMLMRLPDSISLDIGAALTVQPLTGYHMLHTIYRLKSGDTVLINAIGGGVGLFTTQLAVNAGARVIGTVGTPGKEKLALDYGAERVIVTPDEDFEQAVMEFSGGRGVDLAIDSLGATMLDRTFNVVRKLGHIISIGEAEGQPFKKHPRADLAALTDFYAPAHRPRGRAIASLEGQPRLDPARRRRRLAEGADGRHLPDGRSGSDAPLPRIAPSRRQASSADRALTSAEPARYVSGLPPKPLMTKAEAATSRRP